jgi:spore maturation protein CgeB
VFVETSLDEFHPDVLDEARHHTVTLAWNSDDDWRWAPYSSQWCAHYSYMVTTYRHIYEQNVATNPNLLLSQWGCTGLFDGARTAKDLSFTFVGACYPGRTEFLAAVKARTPLRIYSKAGSPEMSRFDRVRRRASRVLYGQSIAPVGQRLDYADVNGVWNRTKVSLTPLEASKDRHLQIKGRVFEMGLSGTVMLCSRNAALAEFYEAGTEYVDYESVEECCEKARYLMTHDSQRKRIADAYRERTRREHMWSQRYDRLFAQIGLPT